MYYKSHWKRIFNTSQHRTRRDKRQTPRSDEHDATFYTIRVTQSGEFLQWRISHAKTPLVFTGSATSADTIPNDFRLFCVTMPETSWLRVTPRPLPLYIHFHSVPNIQWQAINYIWKPPTYFIPHLRQRRESPLTVRTTADTTMVYPFAMDPHNTPPLTHNNTTNYLFFQP